MKGRSTVMVGIRLTDEAYKVIAELANRRGMTVSGFIKGKVEALAVNTINTTGRSVNQEGLKEKVVNTMEGKSHSVNTTKLVGVLTDEKGKKYKLIGGVRYYV